MRGAVNNINHVSQAMQGLAMCVVLPRCDVRSIVSDRAIAIASHGECCCSGSLFLLMLFLKLNN